MFTDMQVRGKDHLNVYACRDISAGEEICICYMTSGTQDAKLHKFIHATHVRINTILSYTHARTAHVNKSVVLFKIRTYCYSDNTRIFEYVV